MNFIKDIFKADRIKVISVFVVSLSTLFENFGFWWYISIICVEMK